MYFVLFNVGLEFYAPCGLLYFSNKSKTLLQEYKNKGRKFPETVTILEREQIKLKYPYLNVPLDADAIIVKQAGCINPRVLLKAQQQIAMNHGCQIIADIVDSIHLEPSGHHIVNTDSGKQISTKKVLLATGAFTECRNLLPKGFSPAMNSTTETVLFVSTSMYDKRSWFASKYEDQKIYLCEYKFSESHIISFSG